MRSEKYGFRDETISRWHRTIGPYYACDLDTIIVDTQNLDSGFKLLEYDISYGEPVPVAIIDWKHENCILSKELDSISIKAQARLATAASIPSFLVTYTTPISMFGVYPTNPLGYQFMKLPQHQRGIMLSEKGMVKLEHYLRKRKKVENE